MDGDVIDVVGQFRVLQPDVVRFGDRYRLADMCAGPVQIADHPFDRQVVTEQHLVADQHSLDRVRVTVGQGNQGIELFLIVLQPGVDHGAGHHLQALFLGQPVGLRILQGRVGANASGIAAQHLQVAIDLVVAGEILLQRVLVALEERHRHAVDLAVPVLRAVREVAPPPQTDI